MVLAAAILAAALAQTARAESDWSGPYVGVNGGYAWGRASTAFNGDGDGDGLFAMGGGLPSEPPDGGFNQAMHGAIYGVYFGYNVPVVGGLVAGFEGVYDRGNIFAQTLAPMQSVIWPGSVTAMKLYVDTLMSLAPQVGYAFGPVLLRVKGGAVAGRVVSRLWDSIGTDGLGDITLGPTTFDQDQTRLGWTWGTGVDCALGRHWSAGVAYDYVDLGTIHYGGVSIPDVFYPISYAVHPILHSVTARLSYRFGSGGEDRAPAPRAHREPELTPLEAVIDSLIRNLKTGDEKARAKAAIRLGELSSKDAVEPLIAALSDDSIHVRGAAADALGKIGDGRALGPLTELLRDSEPKVRALTARALGALGDSQALLSLKKLTAHDRDSLVRKTAAAAVARLGKPEPSVEELLRR